MADIQRAYREELMRQLERLKPLAIATVRRLALNSRDPKVRKTAIDTLARLALEEKKAV